MIKDDVIVSYEVFCRLLKKKNKCDRDYYEFR